MTSANEALLRALESDCAHNLQSVLSRRRTQDYQALLHMVSPDVVIAPRHRAQAIYVLGRWGDPVAAAPIRQILPQLDEGGRANAADALGRLGTPVGLDGVRDCLNDPSSHVRKYATRALGRIGGGQARELLRTVAAQDQIDHIRRMASRILDATSPR
jgi:HEAT repeat protein